MIPVTLSTSSVYPESTASAFEIASLLGYDGVEIMVGTDSISQDPNALLALRDHYGVPIRSIHAPCLLITQRVWGTDPWVKLERAQQAAELLDADVVVVHPPFRWQRDYARRFVAGIDEMAQRTHLRFCVENMYPWRTGAGNVPAYAPGWDVRDEPYRHCTLDLSHTAVSGTDAQVLAADLGDRLAHLHLADGSGARRDEHLVPGRGTQPAGAVLESLGRSGFDGQVVVEVSTRACASREARLDDLAESLAFARLHLDAGGQP